MSRVKRGLSVVVVAGATVAVSVLPASAAPGPHTPYTRAVSVTAEGGAGDGVSREAVVSRDGRYAAFSSEAGDLLPGGGPGVFVRDLRSGRLERVGDGHSPSISADGRHVAHITDADEVLLHDRRTGRTERIDVDVPAAFGTTRQNVSISGDARYAVFTAGTQYDSEEGGSVVFLRDRVAGTTERISHPRPTWEPRNAGDPSVSDDGRRVVYDHRYANGPRGDDWGDIWMVDRATGDRVQIDRSHDGTRTERESLRPSISADGRTVVFESADTHLVPGDTDGSWNVFVHTVATGANVRIHGTQGGPGEVYTRDPAVSADGRYVTFMSELAEPGSEWGKEWPVYLRDLKKGTTTLVTPDTTGGAATAGVAPGGIARGARVIAFTSADATLIPGGDGNEGSDAFVRRLR